MTFLDMYGEGLDFELGSADRTERFTNVRRKRAINNAQREFIRATDAFQLEAQIDLTTDIQEYDLEAVINDEAFFRFTDEQPWVEMTDAGGRVTTLAGLDFPRRDPAQLDREEQGWRSAPGSMPMAWYLREEGGRTFFGLYPMPSIPSGGSWLVFVPYSGYPADMTADDHEPFSATAGGNPKRSLAAYHQALVHRAAADMEKLRRDRAQVKEQMSMFNSYVRDYREHRNPTAGHRVSLARDYFRDAQHRGGPARDPRRWP